MKRLLFPLALAVAITWGLPAHAQNLLLNGDFEAPPHAPEDQSFVVTDWTVGGTGRIHSIAEGSTSGTYSAAFNISGDSQGTTLSQSFATTNGATYAIDFDAAIF